MVNITDKKGGKIIKDHKKYATLGNFYKEQFENESAEKGLAVDMITAFDK